MTGSIICGVDDSESAKGAARVARELSARLRLRLVFVRVVEEGTHEGRIAAIAERLHHLADGAPEVDRGAHWVVEVGHAADRLVAAAEKENAVLIVVGSTGPRSSLLGSISAELSRRAPCAVVVVPPGAGSIRLGSIDNRTKEDRGERAFAGGIVRFNLGGGGDPIVRWENEGGAVLPRAARRGRRERDEEARRAASSARAKSGDSGDAGSLPPSSTQVPRRPHAGAA